MMGVRCSLSRARNTKRRCPTCAHSSRRSAAMCWCGLTRRTTRWKAGLPSPSQTVRRTTCTRFFLHDTKHTQTTPSEEVNSEVKFTDVTDVPQLTSIKQRVEKLEKIALRIKSIIDITPSNIQQNTQSNQHTIV